MSRISRGLSSIAREILEDAVREAESLVVNAESEAKSLLEDAEKEAEKRYISILEAGDENMQNVGKKKLTMFEIETKTMLLKAEDEIIDGVFEKTLNRLREYALTNEYRSCLRGLIGDACNKMGSKKVVIRTNQNDLSWLSANILEEISNDIHVTLVKSDKSIEIVGGVLAQSADGKIIVDNSFENRLDSLKTLLRVKIANMLFKEEAKSK